MDEEADEREWVVFIKGALREAGTREEAPNPSIFMASSPLRGLKLEAFIPQVVAIGPLHSDVGPHHSSFPDNPETQRYKTIAVAEMERHKIMASHHLSKSFPGGAFSTLVDAFMQDIQTVRAQYDTILACKTDEKFAYMLALDAAFVVEVLRSDAYNPLSDGSKSSYCRRFPHPLRKSILQDFVLLENQIPLFLLLKTIRMNQNCESEEKALKTLKDLVRKFASEVLPFSCLRDHESYSSVVNTLGEKKHLLDCLYELVTHDGNPKGSSPCKQQVVEKKHLLDCLYGLVTHDGNSNGSSPSKQVGDKPTHFPSAEELNNCGVKFKPIMAGNMSSVEFDPKRAILSVPHIRVGDDTERLMRNLIAYESHLINNLQVLSYLRFMNGLVDTPEDVALLVDKGIIAQDIGSNEQVAKMWNNLCVNTMPVWTQKYEDVAVQLNHHCKFKMNALKAEFKRTYLSRPWLVISVLSGASLLIMTFIITSYTVKLYLKPGG